VTTKNGDNHYQQAGGKTNKKVPLSGTEAPAGCRIAYDSLSRERYYEYRYRLWLVAYRISAQE
jgi:hypothetical protein